MSANVFTLPLGVPFLEALARAILNGDLPVAGGRAPDILSLPKITLLLPTRRAARVAREAFLAVAKTRALIMPRIQPISEGEGDLSLITSIAELGPSGAEALEQPPADQSARPDADPDAARRAMAPDDGRDRLAIRTPRSDRRRHKQRSSPPNSAKLMDDIERENVSLSGIQTLVPETYSEHWNKTVDFLKIVTEFWPPISRRHGLTSPEARRNALILAEADRIAKLKPDEVVIVAGVTGSIPSTVTLMRAVAAHPSGAIVLPALDHSLDEESWNADRARPSRSIRSSACRSCSTASALREVT